MREDSHENQALFDNTLSVGDGIIKTIKKKSFLRCFTSPDLTRSQTSSQAFVREP